MDDTAGLLRLVSVGKTFGDATVLDGISFSVGANEFLTILGPSGSGKTTILRLIGGFERPTAGRILLEGRDITDAPINRRPFNTVFQDYALFPHLSVRKNIAYGLTVRGVGARETERRVLEALSVVALDGLAARLPHELSGGQRQRVALARAIICEPRLILLDEPLAALDVALRAQMCAFLKSIQRRLEIAFVFITHDQQEAIAMSDRIIVMRAGRIEQTGSPQDLYHRPGSRFVAGFFGENNLIAGRVLEAAGETCAVETQIGILTGCRAPGSAVGERVHVAIRPEQVRLADGPGLGRPFVVRDVQFAGASTVVDAVDAHAGETPLRLRLPGGRTERTPCIGEAVSLTWAEASAAVVRDESPHDP